MHAVACVRRNWIANCSVANYDLRRSRRCQRNFFGPRQGWCGRRPHGIRLNEEPCQKWLSLEQPFEGAPSMGKSITDLSSVTTVGLDLAEHVFQVHGVDASGRVVVKGSAEAPDEAQFAGRDIMLARRYVALNDELEKRPTALIKRGGVNGDRKREENPTRAERPGAKGFRRIRTRLPQRRGAEDYRTQLSSNNARHGNRGGGEGDGRKDQHDRRAIEAHEGEGPDGRRRRRLDRARLTKAEEIADGGPRAAVRMSAVDQAHRRLYRARRRGVGFVRFG